MATEVKALCVHEPGWLGSVVVAGGGGTATVTPAATSGAYQVLDQLQTAARATIDVSFTWGLNSDGRVTLACDTAFTLTLSATAAQRLGFTSTTYGAVAFRFAETTPPAALRPYADEQGGVWLAMEDVRLTTRRGVAGHDTGWRLSCPATRPRRPQLRFAVLRSNAQAWLSAWQRLGTPAKVDTFDGSTVTTLHVTRLAAREESAASGWTSFDLEVLR